jgi:hypothetical protein
MLNDDLERIVAALRTDPAPSSPDLDARVMGAIRGSWRWRLRALRGWWLRPRPVPVSPFRALLGAAAMASVAFAVMARPGAPVESRPVLVRFVLAAPGATRVDLVGDFNGWAAGSTPLAPVGDAGVWTVEVPLGAGPHEYAFVVDGREWRPDPAAPRAAGEDFGQPNSGITVGGDRS